MFLTCHPPQHNALLTLDQTCGAENVGKNPLTLATKLELDFHVLNESKEISVQQSKKKKKTNHPLLPSPDFFLVLFYETGRPVELFFSSIVALIKTFLNRN